MRCRLILISHSSSALKPRPASSPAGTMKASTRAMPTSTRAAPTGVARAAIRMARCGEERNLYRQMPAPSSTSGSRVRWDVRDAKHAVARQVLLIGQKPVLRAEPVGVFLQVKGYFLAQRYRLAASRCLPCAGGSGSHPAGSGGRRSAAAPARPPAGRRGSKMAGWRRW